ncbi:MAG: DnaJ domain-containing protein [Pyrinomonadaceae bacterium]|nr:DnaJ domain-containing protein [Pyrinomonadaceae bacterium]
MESPSNLDTNGSLRINPLAELFTEIAQNRLNGSLRIEHAAQKIVVYFDAGETVFAVSNARRHRLFEMLLQADKISREQLVAIPEFTSDLSLKESLIKNNLFEKTEINAIFLRQILEILKTALDWREGGWTFSPLVRIKGDIRFPADPKNLLVQHARNVPLEEIARKLNNPQESFSVRAVMPANVNLSPPESFVYSRIEKSLMTIEEIQVLSGMPDAETRRIIYTLWLGGFLVREKWSAAFSERKIAAITAAHIALKKEEQKPKTIILPNESKRAANVSTPPKTAKIQEIVEEAAPVEKQISLDEYLQRIKNAANYYEIFALAPDAAHSEIKQTYFGLAKRFHPDLYYRESNTELLDRIQSAFGKIAQAYETLKNINSRDAYDFKVRRELAEMKAVRQSETTFEAIDLQKQTDEATENFERGFSFLIDGNYGAAVPFLARAVHSAKDNARYQAYFGKALAADAAQRHKAEGALQTAIKLDGENADYRIMLAEFFINFNLLKRAEGELNRLLVIFPNHREAQSLLDSLRKK